MVGDNYDTDILAGIRFGIDTVHIEGGVTSLIEVRAKELQPTHLLRSFADWDL
jgi:4-nitrophenyl phosphatase